MAWRCTGRNNDEMVDKFVHMGIITSKEVEDSFRLIPRGAFVPTERQDEAYVDAPIRGDPHVHMSAPHMYATILEALDLQPGFAFLNIGSGTGYFSSLAGYVLKRGSTNHGIEVYEDLMDFANERLEEFLRYSPQVGREFCQPRFIAGNCFRLDPSDRKYDRIYSGAACPASKISFIVQLTKVGGYAIVPCRNKLLKLERLSAAQVRQTCISDVCFASLVSLPEREASLPKLRFPDNEQKLKQKIRALPPCDIIVSRSKARKMLARLRAIQEAVESLKYSGDIPLPFCYVPCQNQVQSLIKKRKPKQEIKRSSISITSPVDSKISFFSMGRPLSSHERTVLGESAHEGGVQNRSPLHALYSADTQESDVWDYLATETLWQTVLEHYYSMCNVTNEKKKKALKVYVKKSKQQLAESKKYPSFAEIAKKMGLIAFPVSPLSSFSQIQSPPPSTPVLQVEPPPISSHNERDVSEKSVAQPAITGVEGDLVSERSPAVCVDEIKSDAGSCSHGNNTVGQTVTDSCVSTANTQVIAESCLSQTTPLEEKPAYNVTIGAASKDGCLPSNSKAVDTCVLESSGFEKDEDRLLIRTDKELVDRLVSSPAGDWKLEEDYELVQFLSGITQKSNKGRCKGWFRSELTRPELFTKEDIMGYPRIASYTPEELAYRTTILCRIAKILDSVLYLLSGPSLLKEQSLFTGKYTLESISESSFVSSKSLWGSNVTLGVKVSENEKSTEKVVLPVVDKDEAAVNNSKELECVRCEQQLVLKKIKLTQALQDQYKEQQKLLKRQMRLVEEQQQLLQNIHLRDYMKEEQAKENLSELQLDVTELKSQRLELLNKQQHLTEQQGDQDQAKNDLFTRLKKLKGNEQRLLQNGKRKQYGNISSSGGGVAAVGSASGLGTSDEKKPGKREMTAVNQPISLRFYLSDLLPQVRFLLPLCQQRWRIVHGLLHASELPSPDHMPVITVDRRQPLPSRNIHNHSSVVMQVYKELRVEGLHFRWNKRKYDQWWEVKFVGEGIIDQGGGFRDSLAEIADELCPSGEGAEVLPFFIKTPNNRDKVGDHLDGYIPNPSCDNTPGLIWIGQLMGGMFRSDESLTLCFPPFVWKLFVGEHVTWSHDYVSVDEAAVKITDDLEAMDEELYNQTYGSLCTFSTVLSNGVRVELVPGGEEKHVTPEEREKYVALVRRKRMMESTQQVLAIKKGLLSVLPASVLQLLTWRELERAICGDPDISVSVLKSACQYGDDLSESSASVQFLWAAVAQFTVEERSGFLRFVTGRKRPPAPFTVSKASGDLDCLPNASTCASTLFLPTYSTATIATEKIRYAIHNCVAIDTDTSPW